MRLISYGVIFIQNPGLKATEPMQCLIDDIMAGVYIPRKFKLSSNPFRRRNWRLFLSYMSSGFLAPVLLQEWFFLYRLIFSVAKLECFTKYRKSSSSKTFYDEGKTDLQTITPAECFGDFWNDIFSIKIMKKKDERITIQKNIKSHQIIHGVKNELSDCKKRADLGLLRLKFINELSKAMS